jgi:hypothetical protein
VGTGIQHSKRVISKDIMLFVMQQGGGICEIDHRDFEMPKKLGRQTRNAHMFFEDASNFLLPLIPGTAPQESLIIFFNQVIK